jgi:hypothetical protein
LVGWRTCGDPGVEVGEPGSEDSERLAPFEGLADVVKSGALCAGVTEDAGEHIGRGGGPFDLGVVGMEVVGDDESGVRAPASGHRHVQRFSGEGVVGEEHGVVDGDALRLVDGEGVAERDLLGHVVGR